MNRSPNKGETRKIAYNDNLGSTRWQKTRSETDVVTWLISRETRRPQKEVSSKGRKEAFPEETQNLRGV